MPSLVLLNVSQTLVDEIRDWARQRRLTTDDAAIALLKMALDSVRPPQSRVADEKTEFPNQARIAGHAGDACPGRRDGRPVRCSRVVRPDQWRRSAPERRERGEL